ncbi:hypothetical protein LTR56_005572 [Elasticomyces elasticus]|nr:hypothetical protein LTR22_017159 [Elasticomyces elasticus]KAK3651764.1 hypothetical protein LTR56_005572 [Elasticomyces elasticus]KAK4913331.1 hypothetical protein LTR49_018312 [Elasticomyces elasticus]KAK5769137.1 hypothetical protein LTS12_000488 [Elasticomyces elasticus]
MAATWAGLVRDDKKVAASELEKIGKMVYGDDKFQTAMAGVVGGSGVTGEEEGEGETI